MRKTQGPWWLLMQAILAIELVGLGWLLWINLGQLFNLFKVTGEGAGQVIGLQLSIVLVLLCAAIWVGASLRGAIRKKSWVRSSNFTIQILALAGATGVLQGIIGTKVFGLALLLISVAGILASVMIIRAQKSLK